MENSNNNSHSNINSSSTPANQTEFTPRSAQTLTTDATGMNTTGTNTARVLSDTNSTTMNNTGTTSTADNTGANVANAVNSANAIVISSTGVTAASTAATISLPTAQATQSFSIAKLSPVAVTPLSNGDGGGNGNNGTIGSTAAPVLEEEFKNFVQFTGTGKELFKIYIRNFLLTLITLGVYSFWGKVRIRSYLWEHTRILGEPLEYTGTGWELFRSFLIVMPVISIAATSFYFAGEEYLALAYLVVLILGTFLFHVAVYQALRYRFSRTRWRGIRGNMDGSALKYGIKAFLYSLLSLVTMGLCSPLSTARTTTIRANNFVFGDKKFTFKGDCADLYAGWGISIGVSFALIFVLMIIIAIVCVIFATAFSAFTHNFSQMNHEDGQIVAIIVALIYISSIVIIGAAAYIYEATKLRWLYAGLKLGNAEFRANGVTNAGFFFLNLRNMFLLLFTLGIAFPWVVARTIAFVLNAVEYRGNLELETIGQDTTPDRAKGEGLLDALDISVGF